MATTVSTKRNDTEVVFQQEEKKRGANKGALIMAPPKVTTDNLDLIVKWIGAKELAGIINGRLRTLASGWTESAEDSNGEFQADAFRTYAESFSARGETMDELEEQIDNLLAELAEAATAGDSAKVLECGMNIKSLKAEIESKKRPRKQKNGTPEAATATA